LAWSLRSDLDARRGKLQRSALDELARARDVHEDDREVDATMRGRVRPEPAGSLLELSFATGTVGPLRVQPCNRDVDETLEEVTLALGRLAPLVLQLLVRVEVLARSDQLQPSFEAHRVLIIDIRGRC
jgi:hypothetical protein